MSMSNKYKGKKRMETSSQGWENGTTLFGRLAVSQNRVLGKYMCVKGQESRKKVQRPVSPLESSLSQELPQ